MSKIFKTLMAVTLVASIGLLSACKKNFDNPPGAADPDMVANTSIKALKAMHTSAGAYDIITSDLVISGVVVADDKSGNLYKQLYIQDATGGLQILLDATNLYGTYPVGRRIFIKCKDLCISDYNGLMALGVKATVNGLPSQEGIPANVISRFVIGGSIGNPVTPIVVTQNQLGTNMQDQYLGSLIQLDGYEFSDTTDTFSDTSAYKSTVNLDIKNCSGQTIIIRTSAYANFAAKKVPGGNGSVVAIYTTFGTTKQLLLRNAEDVMFTGNRCSLFEEDFNSIGANNATLTLPGWRNIQEVGSNPNSLYQNAVFGSGPTKCAKVSAFSTGGAATTWLITPAISLAGTTTPKLLFQTSAGFVSAVTPQFRVYISTTYPGSGTPSTYFTTQLTASIATPPAGGGFSSFISSGVINLSTYAGQTIYIAYRYDGNDPSGTASDATATYEVENVSVTRQ